MSDELRAPCSDCLRETRHDVLHRVEHDNGDFVQEFSMIRCRGCGLPSLRTAVYDSLKDAFVGPTYFPSPMTRPLPVWVLTLATPFQGSDNKRQLGRLLREVYEAVRSGHYRLAAMGVRAALETVMINEVGDLGSFDANMKEFEAKGFISRMSRDAMAVVIDVGHAAIHRLHAPSVRDLKTAIDVLEGILAPIYAHSTAARELAKRTPRRPSRKSKAPKS